MTFNTEEKILLATAKIHPTEADLATIQAELGQLEDVIHFSQFITDRCAAPLLYNHIGQLKEADTIPAELKANLKRVYLKTLTRSMLLHEHLKEILSLFQENKIEVLPLKGSLLSEKLYKDVALRQFSDLDLLVHPEDGEKCLELLKSIGYGSSEMGMGLSKRVLSTWDIVHFLPMLKNEISVEIHIKLHPRNDKYNFDPLEVWKNAVPTQLLGYPIFEMDLYDQIIHICLHLHKHISNDKVQTTCYFDIVNLITEKADEIDWWKLKERANQYGAADEVFQHIISTATYFNCSIPEDILQEFNYLLNNENIADFCTQIAGKGKVSSVSNVKTHFKNVGTFASPFERILYVRDVLFPSRLFMRNQYKINKEWKVPFYYFYRLWIGVKGLWGVILKRRK